MADNKISKAKKGKLTISEVERFKDETKVLPSSKFLLIQREETPEPSGRKDRNKLSNNNFLFDMEGNVLIEGRYLKKEVYADIAEFKFELYNDKKALLFWKVEKHYVSDSSMSQIERCMDKSFKNFLKNKREANEMKFTPSTLVETSIWLETTSDVFEDQAIALKPIVSKTEVSFEEETCVKQEIVEKT